MGGYAQGGAQRGAVEQPARAWNRPQRPPRRRRAAAAAHMVLVAGSRARSAGRLNWPGAVPGANCQRLANCSARGGGRELRSAAVGLAAGCRAAHASGACMQAVGAPGAAAGRPDTAQSAAASGLQAGAGSMSATRGCARGCEQAQQGSLVGGGTPPLQGDGVRDVTGGAGICPARPRTAVAATCLAAGWPMLGAHHLWRCRRAARRRPPAPGAQTTGGAPPSCVECASSCLDCMFEVKNAQGAQGHGSCPGPAPRTDTAPGPVARSDPLGAKGW